MKDFFSGVLSSEGWLIRESEWDPERQGINETLLALGNGSMGSRSVLEEIPAGAVPGTFFAGVFDSIGAQVTELVNAPNPFDFRISVRGEKLSPAAMSVVEHKRILDMRQGTLFRKTVFQSAQKKRFEYQSARFLSLADHHVGVMRIYLTPLDEAAEFEITNTVDTAVANMGQVTEGWKRHLLVDDVSPEGIKNYLCVKTFEHEIRIGYATQLDICRGGAKKVKPQSHRVFRINLRKGETACFTKFFSFRTARRGDPRRLREKALATLDLCVKSGFGTLFRQHRRAWERMWGIADFDIVGDKDVQKAIRFNIYHLLICATDKGEPVGIGAKSLTGEGYRGHSFWDTEIFTLPFYIHTLPAAAKHLLQYRHERLGEARKLALGRGYKGAMFPWESADTGREASPSWYKDDEGVVRRVETGEQEHHITAAIAFGVWNYFNVTGDTEFMLRRGLELLLETARFWASRVQFQQRKKIYEIKHVIGPDEFHEDVDNNAYTNTMAKWNLWVSSRVYQSLKRRFPVKVRTLARRLGFSGRELQQWKRVRQSLVKTLPEDKRGLLEQFDGFFRRRYIRIRERDAYGLPVYPKEIGPGDLNGTQFVKQADVVLLMYLFPDAFTKEQKRRNYDYYERRTLHKSSLSPSIHALMGLEAGRSRKAYEYLTASLRIDLNDIHKNTSHGIHIAACGGSWQALVHGFGGAQVRRGVLCIEPRLPAQWSAMRFCVRWRGFLIRVAVDKERVRLRFSSRRKRDFIVVRVFGSRTRISSGKMYSFPKASRGGKRLYVKKERAPAPGGT